MGYEPLVFIVEHTIGDALADPFELIARLEEELGQADHHAQACRQEAANADGCDKSPLRDTADDVDLIRSRHTDTHN
jgi:hypothetical protein